MNFTAKNIEVRVSAENGNIKIWGLEDPAGSRYPVKGAGEGYWPGVSFDAARQACVFHEDDDRINGTLDRVVVDPNVEQNGLPVELFGEVLPSVYPALIQRMKNRAEAFTGLENMPLTLTDVVISDQSVKYDPRTSSLVVTVESATVKIGN